MTVWQKCAVDVLFSNCYFTKYVKFCFFVVQKGVLKALNEGLLSKLIQLVLGNLAEDSAAQSVEILASLIKLSANIKDIRHLISKLPEALQKVDSFERSYITHILKVNYLCQNLLAKYIVFSSRWQLVDVITEKLAGCPEEEETWRRSVTTAAFKCLIASYSHTKDQATSPSAQEQNILDRLQKLLVGPVSSDIHHIFGFISFIFIIKRYCTDIL